MASELVCPFCNNYSTSHRGALNLHKRACELKQLREQHKEPDNKTQDQRECKHEFRALNSLQTIEARAIQNGFMEVCVKCQTLQ